MLTYPLTEACAVTGGYVVRDEALRSLYGRYLYGDFCVGELRSFTADPVARRPTTARSAQRSLNSARSARTAPAACTPCPGRPDHRLEPR